MKDMKLSQLLRLIENIPGLPITGVQMAPGLTQMPSSDGGYVFDAVQQSDGKWYVEIGVALRDGAPSDKAQLFSVQIDGGASQAAEVIDALQDEVSLAA